MESTLSEYIQSQEELVKEAALALPHSFSQCTYPLGPLRQFIFAQPVLNPVASAQLVPSLAIQIMNKLNCFQSVDFGVIVQPAPLLTHARYIRLFNPTIRKTPMGRISKEVFAVPCLIGFTSPVVTSACGPVQGNLLPTPAQDSHQPPPEAQNEGETIDDSLSDASSSGLPPPLINGDEYESFVCSACVLRSPILKRWAGTFGTIMVVRDNSADSWRRLNGVPMDPESPIDVQDTPHASGSGVKRPSSPSNLTEPEPKRAKYSSPAAHPRPPCLAPVQPQPALRVLESLTTQGGSTDLGTGDLFLTEGFRDRWCHCSTCQPQLEMEPWLLQDEETYEPPEDPDSGLSLEELGMRALERIPRDRAIDGIHAFNKLRGDLLQFLRPFAQEGKVVNEADVKQFFENLTEASKQDPK